MKRSKWKGPLIRPINSKQKLPLLSRSHEVTAQLVGLTCNVYSGKKFVKIILEHEMVGHKIGEFIPTRERFEFKKKKKKK